MTAGQFSLRVIAGSLKGLSLKSPKNSKTHPMGAREKLALFNMLAERLRGAKVLDIYAGSGALGIEALSRSARTVIWVEQDRSVAQVLKDNVKKAQESLMCSRASTADQGSSSEAQSALDDSRIFVESAEKFCLRPDFQQFFDIILADPPYDHFRAESLASLSRLLAPEGILALSHPKGVEVKIPHTELVSDRSYAAAGISLYHRVD